MKSLIPNSILSGSFLSMILFLALPARAQVLQTPAMLEPGIRLITIGPAIEMEDGLNDIGILLNASTAVTRGIDLRFKFMLLEDGYYYGGDIEFLFRREKPALSFTAGGHYIDDPAVDATLKASFPILGIFDMYVGADTDLILDDNPDLPIWAFAGFRMKVTEQVDVLAEFNFGTVEVAPHLLAAGIAIRL